MAPSFPRACTRHAVSSHAALTPSGARCTHNTADGKDWKELAESGHQRAALKQLGESVREELAQGAEPSQAVYEKMLGLIELCVSLGDLSAARDWAEQTLSVFKDDVVALYWRLEMCMHLGDTDTVDAQGQHLLAMIDRRSMIGDGASDRQGAVDHPIMPRSAEQLAEVTAGVCTHMVSLRLNKWAGGVHAGANNPKVRPHMAEGRTLYHDVPDDVIELVQRGLAAQPSHVVLRILHAQAFITANRFRDALRVLDEAAELDPNMAPIYHKRGECHFMMSQVGPAIHDFTKFLQMQPELIKHGSLHSDAPRVLSSFADAYMKRGIAYQRYGDMDSALEDFTAVVDLNAPEWSDRARVHRALFYLKQNKSLWDGVEDCTAVLRRNPKNLAALKARADLYEKLGRKSEAAEDMRNYKVAEREYTWNLGRS